MASARLVGMMPGCDWRTLKFDDGRGRNECEPSRSDGFQRLAHVKSAVMPERHSFVQRALKRKIENRLEASPSSSMVRDSHLDAVDIEGQLQKAIESERNYFDSVKKCRLQGDYQPADFENMEMCGRFIRTGQPCHQSEEELYPKVSYLDAVSPYIHKSDKVVAFSSADGSSFGMCSTSSGVAMGSFPVLEDARVAHDQQSPNSFDRIHMPALSPIARCHKFSIPARPDSLTKWSPAGSAAATQLLRPGSAAESRSSSDFARHIPSQQAVVHASSFSKAQTSHQQGQVHRTRVDRSRSRNNCLSAFYSLGRQAASTLGSPAACLPALNGPRPLHQHSLSQHDESRLSKNQSSGRGFHVNESHRSKFVAANENRIPRRRLLDCRTEETVRSGKFGSLQTLQNFYSKLCSDNAVVSPFQSAIRGRLGSITNCRPYQASRSVERLGETYDCSSAKTSLYSPSQESAIDLSLHKRAPQCDVIAEQYSRAHEYESCRRSRSRCEELQLQKPCLEQLKAFVDRETVINEHELAAKTHRVESSNPHCGSPFFFKPRRFAAEVKLEHTMMSSEHQRPNCSSVRKECTTPDYCVRWAADQQPLPQSATSCLPLKKRRLLDAQTGSDGMQSPSPPREEHCSNFTPQRLSAVKYEVLNVADETGSVDRLELPSMPSPAAMNSDEDEDLPLHSAIANGNRNMIDQILNIMARLKMPVDRYNNYKQTPLHVAILTDQPAVVKRLLEAGSSPNVVDLEGMTSVHLASSLKSSKCLDCILQHSVVPLDLGVVAKNGQTALQVAAQRCNLSAVMSLVNAGAYLDPYSEQARVPSPNSDVNVERSDPHAKRSSLSYSPSSAVQCLPDQVVLTCRTGVSRHLNVHVSTDVRC